MSILSWSGRGAVSSTTVTASRPSPRIGWPLISRIDAPTGTPWSAATEPSSTAETSTRPLDGNVTWRPSRPVGKTAVSIFAPVMSTRASIGRADWAMMARLRSLPQPSESLPVDIDDGGPDGHALPLTVPPGLDRGHHTAPIGREVKP